MIECAEWYDGMMLWRGTPRPDETLAKGYCFRNYFNRAYWHAFFTHTSNTLKRDGKMTFGGNMWYSQTSFDAFSYPYAVTDDYGVLVPVRNPNG